MFSLRLKLLFSGRNRPPVCVENSNLKLSSQHLTAFFWLLISGCMTDYGALILAHCERFLAVFEFSYGQGHKKNGGVVENVFFFFLFLKWTKP